MHFPCFSMVKLVKLNINVVHLVLNNQTIITFVRLDVFQSNKK